MDSEKLPSSFDVVVIGTGLPEAMVAASLSRIGKSVLHIDRNDYYGGQWATFNLDSLFKWVDRHSMTTKNDSDQDENHIWKIPSINSTFRNVEMYTFIPETSPETSQEHSESTCKDLTKGKVEDENVTQSKENKQPDEIVLLPDDKEEDKADENIESKELKANKPSCDKGNDDDHSAIEEKSQPTVQEFFDNSKLSSMITQAKLKKNASDISMEDLKILSRKFNLDIAPKFLFSAGPLVNAILKANISHYSEFQIVNRILTCKDEEIIEVPCNRSDIFSSTFLSMIEKRTLMKFLTLCVDFTPDSPTDELMEYLKKPFKEFLQTRRLSENLQKFIIYSIAMVKPETPTEIAMKETCSFLKSLGRYGKSPFIWPLYGVGELPQAFCRMSAVFGSLYCLSKPPSSLQVNDSKCTKVILGDETIECKYVVMSQGYLPDKFIKTDSMSSEVSRAIVITDASILPSDSESISFLTIPPLKGKKELVRVIELGPSASACPTGLFVLYFSCLCTQKATEDLEDYVKLLTSSKENTESHKPKLLWSLYFNQLEDHCNLEEIPENIYVTKMAGNDLGFKNVVDDAEMIFQKICPEGEFLMTVPNAEDILWDTEQNNDGDGENAKIQDNDQTDDPKNTSQISVECQPNKTEEENVSEGS